MPVPRQKPPQRGGHEMHPAGNHASAHCGRPMKLYPAETARPVLAGGQAGPEPARIRVKAMRFTRTCRQSLIGGF